MNASLRKFYKLCSVAAFASAIIAVGGCASMGNGPEVQPITLEQLVSLAKSGKDASAIIDEIKSTRTTYDVSASQYAKLSRDGVPDAVLDFMQQGQIKMAEREGRREARQDAWLYGSRFGYGYGYGYGGIWEPRAYVVYVGGRAFTKSF